MDRDDAIRAREIVQHYRPEGAAPLIAWGIGLSIATPLLLWLTFEMSARRSDYVILPGLLTVACGITAAALLIWGSWRVARNTDYVAAVTYLQVEAELQEARRARREGA